MRAIAATSSLSAPDQIFFVPCCCAYASLQQPVVAGITHTHRSTRCFFHVSLVPIIGVVGEEKTKPTQHSVQQLRAAGLTPDFLVCRSGEWARVPGWDERTSRIGAQCTCSSDSGISSALRPPLN
eukprot:scaffold79414_cov30-Tisochrysis_lutea.AAC.4